MMDAGADAGMVVGVFRDAGDAREAAEALVKAGFAPDMVRLVEPDIADADLMAELTGADAAEWRDELAGIGGALVTVVGGRPTDARAILREHGAEDVADDDDPELAAPAGHVAGDDGGVADVAGKVRPGMLVVGADYGLVGRIKRIEGRDLLLDRRPLRRDVWLPLHAVGTLIGDWVVLTMPADQIDPMEPLMRPRVGERNANPSRVDDEGTP